MLRNARVYLAPTSAAAAVAVAQARSLSVSIDREEVTDLAFGDTWGEIMSGPLSWSGSFDFNYDHSVSTIFDAATQVLGPVRWYAYVDQGAATEYLYGLVWVSGDILSGDVSSQGTGTANFTGSGALSKN